jgi:hypothetical protein
MLMHYMDTVPCTSLNHWRSHAWELVVLYELCFPFLEHTSVLSESESEFLFNKSNTQRKKEKKGRKKKLAIFSYYEGAHNFTENRIYK